MSSAPEIIVTDGPLLSDDALEALARLLLVATDLDDASEASNP